MSRTKWISWAIAGALLSLLVGAGVATYLRKHQGAHDKPPATLEFTSDEVQAPRREALPVTVEFSGPLVATRSAIVRTREAARLLTLAVAEGERVKAGQALGTLDLTTASSRVAERNAMFESAKAQLAQAERTHASNRDLAQQNYISNNALEASRVAVEAARAQLRAAQAQLATTRAGWSDALLVAPIDGIVSKRHVVAGEKLAPEQTVLTIVDLAELELAGTVGTHEVSRLATGVQASVRIEGVDQAVAGTIDRIAPAAEAGTRAIGVVVKLKNPGERFRAGQYAVARVDIPDAEQRLTVPIAAVSANAGQDYVWVIDGGVLVRRAVTLGRRDPMRGRVEVLSGLAEQSQVLAVRFDNLKEGGPARYVARPAQLAADGAEPAPVRR